MIDRNRDGVPSPVHAAMHGLPVLVGPGPPGVVPEPAPAALLLIADQVRDNSALSLQLGEPAEDGESGGTSTDDANLPDHCLTAVSDTKL